MGNDLGKAPLSVLCTTKIDLRETEEWHVGVRRLLSPCLFQLEYLSPCLPTPWEWSFVMSKLPGATIGCDRCPADQTKLRGREPSLSSERYIYRGWASWSRHQRSCNMAKVAEKSWEPQTTNTKRWRKRKNQSRSRSRGASKVLKIYKKVKRSLHMSSRKKYSPKVITTSRRKKRARRANKFQPLP